MIRVRRLVPADLEGLQLLLNNAGIPMDKAMALLNDFMVCHSGESMIGFGCLKQEGAVGYLSWVFIDEAHRKDKLGSAIVKALLNAADLQGVKDVYTASYSDTASICDAFFRSLRFEQLASPIRIVQDRYSEIFGSIMDCFYHVSLDDYFKSCC